MINISELAVQVFSITIAVLGVCFVIAFHEFGHLIFAKLFNVKVPEFSIGFGKKLISKTIGETTYSISAIPLGGYVNISTEKADGSRAFTHKPYWQKMFVISGGICFNLIFAFLVFVILAKVGAPCVGIWTKYNQPIVGETTTTSNFHNKLQTNDLILDINNIPVKNIGELKEQVENLKGQEITFNIERDKQKTEISGKLNDTEPYIGTSWNLTQTTYEREPQTFLESIKESYQGIWNNLIQTLSSILLAFKNKGDGFAGPIGIFHQLSQCAHHWKILLAALAMFSVGLAALNMLPLPILDGGQALIISIESLRGKMLNEDIKYKIFLATWVLLLALTLLFTYRDIMKIFYKPKTEPTNQGK